MYAIVELDGRQHRVEPGSVVDVNRVQGEPGSNVTFDNHVVMLNDDGDVKVGEPVVTGASVQCELVEHYRGPKLSVFKMKRRNRYQRNHGHRQELSRIKVVDISAE